METKEKRACWKIGIALKSLNEFDGETAKETTDHFKRNIFDSNEIGGDLKKKDQSQRIDSFFCKLIAF